MCGFDESPFSLELENQKSTFTHVCVYIKIFTYSNTMFHNKKKIVWIYWIPKIKKDLNGIFQILIFICFYFRNCYSGTYNQYENAVIYTIKKQFCWFGFFLRVKDISIIIKSNKPFPISLKSTSSSKISKIQFLKSFVLKFYLPNKITQKNYLLKLSSSRFAFSEVFSLFEVHV